MVSPVELIRLDVRRFFHVENTSPTLSVHSTALYDAVLSISANFHVASQAKPAVPHASMDAEATYVKHISEFSSTARCVAAHLEVSSAELLHSSRLAIILDNPGK